MAMIAIYGRTIGDVPCKNRSANAEQVRNGMAWVYMNYAPKRSTLYAEEKLARGLLTHLNNWPSVRFRFTRYPECPRKQSSMCPPAFANIDGRFCLLWYQRLPPQMW